MGAISSSRVTRVLAVVVLAMLLASIAGQYFEYLVGNDRFAIANKLIRLFDVDRERNIPTWYSSAALLLCSALLAKIAVAKRRAGSGYVLHWAALSAIFLLVAFDEAASYHEAISHRLRDAFQMRGYLYFSWVVPGAAFAAVIGLAYLRFIARLPSRTRLLFVVAGALYLVGVLAMEALGGRYAELYGIDLRYKMLTTIEEAFEMVGIIAFIHALTSYVGSPAMKDRSVTAANVTPAAVGSAQASEPVGPTAYPA